MSRIIPPAQPPQHIGLGDDTTMAYGILAGFAVLPVGMAIFAHLVGASWKSSALLGGSILAAEIAAVKAGSYRP